MAIRAEGGESAPRGQWLARLRRAWALRGAHRVIVAPRSDWRPAHRAMTMAQQAELSLEQWSDVFARRRWHEEAAAAVMFALPSREDVQEVMHKLADSAPGPDGVRYSAWRVGGSDAVDAIHAVVQEMCAGIRHVGLHDALYVFLPKAPEAEHGSVAVDETRPLALKDIGVKIATIVMSRAVAPVAAASAAREQRGFLAGRNFVDNMWELDAELRGRAMAVDAQGEDIKAVFPRSHSSGFVSPWRPLRLRPRCGFVWLRCTAAARRSSRPSPAWYRFSARRAGLRRVAQAAGGCSQRLPCAGAHGGQRGALQRLAARMRR